MAETETKKTATKTVATKATVKKTTVTKSSTAKSTPAKVATQSDAVVKLATVKKVTEKKVAKTVANGKIRVTMIHGLTACTQRQIRTAKALKLSRPGDTRELPNLPATLGACKKLEHLVKVEII